MSHGYDTIIILSLYYNSDVNVNSKIFTADLKASTYTWAKLFPFCCVNPTALLLLLIRLPRQVSRLEQTAGKLKW